jgi:hypothetical protein
MTRTGGGDGGEDAARELAATPGDASPVLQAAATRPASGSQSPKRGWTCQRALKQNEKGPDRGPWAD